MAFLATIRVDEARQFSQPYRVKNYAGTNYVVRLVETTVGKVETGLVVIVYVRLENPNPTEITLLRDSFVLVDHDKDYFLPTTTGAQGPLIRLPANGVIDKEALSFAVDDDSFAGVVALMIGHQYFVLVKNEKPWTRHLHEGHFMTFRSRDW